MGPNLTRARKSWGDKLPDWVAILAENCDVNGASQASLGSRIGYSAAVVNTVIGAGYKGDLPRVETAVKGALMAHEVSCPVMGDIRADRCLREQNRKLDAANEIRVRLYRACRNQCPHYRKGV